MTQIDDLIGIMRIAGLTEIDFILNEVDYVILLKNGRVGIDRYGDDDGEGYSLSGDEIGEIIDDIELFGNICKETMLAYYQLIGQLLRDIDKIINRRNHETAS